MGGNKTVVYKGPAKVAVEDLDYPELELAEQKRRVDHGVILKAVATKICGSVEDMVRVRSTAPVGQTLCHEFSGELFEVGRDVE
jgi:glutathione-independent formaldehyde dehydrogenase